MTCDEMPMSNEPIKVGRYAPYPVWLGMTLLVRGAQFFFIAFCAWGLVALFDAMDKSSTTSFPPLALWVVVGLIASSPHNWRGKTSPVRDAFGNYLASQQCPACGQNVFDKATGSGYAPPSQRQTIFPSRECANCGHDLNEQTVP